MLCLHEKKALGFIYANQDPKDMEKMEDHVVSIDYIEKQIGINFFSALEPQLEAQLEHKSDFNQW